MSFQFVGFLLTYLLHTTHAAKNGSRAGLGITLIQYSFYLRNRASVLERELANGEIPPELLAPDGSYLGDRIGLTGPAGPGDGPDAQTAEDGWAALWGPAPDTESMGSSSSGIDKISSAASSFSDSISSLISSSASSTEPQRHPQVTGLPSLTAPQREGLEEAMRMSSMANDWLSYVLMVLGWALLIGALLSYWRAVRRDFAYIQCC